MSRPKSTNRSKALKLWLNSGRKMKLKDIALELGVSDSMIRKWKFIDAWDEIPEKRPRGGQPGNKNAVGNSGGPGGPIGNDKAVIHGLFRKFEPQDPEYLEILDAVAEMDPLDMIWFNITKLMQKIIYGQKINHISDKDDMTKELSKLKVSDKGQEETFDIQYAWDKFNAASKAEAFVMRELRGAIKQFLSAAPENDERRAKLDIMQTQVEKMKTEHERVKLQVEKLGGDKKGRKLESFL